MPSNMPFSLLDHHGTALGSNERIATEHLTTCTLCLTFHPPETRSKVFRQKSRLEPRKFHENLSRCGVDGSQLILSSLLDFLPLSFLWDGLPFTAQRSPPILLSRSLPRSPQLPPPMPKSLAASIRRATPGLIGCGVLHTASAHDTRLWHTVGSPGFGPNILSAVSFFDALCSSHDSARRTMRISH